MDHPTSHAAEQPVARRQGARAGAAAAGGIALALALAACGVGARHAAPVARPHRARTNPAPFGWLAPRHAAAAWRLVALPSGAALSRPPGWRAVRTDPGTASFALLGARGAIVAYLNATPRQGAETLADWPAFRTRHNAEEGSRDVRRLAAARGLRFRSGPGSCVIDQYRTVARSYREIACLVAGPHRATVVVGAATPGAWSRQSPVLRRAIATFVG